MEKRHYDTFAMIMDYEEGRMGFEEQVELFSRLVKSGLAWTLQGHYGRVATDFIQSGYLDHNGNVLIEPV